MSFAEHFITVPDGLRLFAREYAPMGDERGVPVFCIHGLTRNSADFDVIAPAIAELGRRVFAIDVRGRGRSDRDPDPARYRPDVYAGDVVFVLDQLKVERAVFIGTSMGGLITMLLGVMAPARVAGAVLNDIGPVVNPAGLARIGGYVGKTMAFKSRDALVAAIKETQGAAFPDADEAFWQAAARRVAKVTDDGYVVFNYDAAIAQAFAQPQSTPPPDLKPLFASLREKPVLVVRGALSDILAPEGVEAMRAIKPDLAVVEVPRVGHAPMLDEPAAVVALVDFLGRVP